MCAILAAVFELSDVLDGDAIAIYCDNEAEAEAMANGDSPPAPSEAMIAKFWTLREKRAISLWIESAVPDDNIADFPTRDRATPPFPLEGPPPLGRVRIFQRPRYIFELSLA